ncbi:MAG TPA: EamA family transporter [Casimicrobiaceae bacterium]|nr:EamA family transporter [Casimicrobiaceae bacterium]
MRNPSIAPTRAALLVLLLALVWGCNWPVLKMGVDELAPLTFRCITLPLAALGMLAFAHAHGESIRIPPACFAKVCGLSFFNVTGWNGFLLFGVQQLPAGRSAILAYTMPIWATAIATFVLHEPISRRKLAGLALGALGMAILLGDQVVVVRKAPSGALLILIAAVSWACGTVLLRKWRPPLPQNALSGWMLLLGTVPLALAAPFLDPQAFATELANLSVRGWFAIGYNVFLAGTLANLAWFMLARTLPVAVSSLSSLPIPVVGVISGMIVLGERPGMQEWIALALVVTALAIVMLAPRKTATEVGTPHDA